MKTTKTDRFRLVTRAWVPAQDTAAADQLDQVLMVDPATGRMPRR